MKFNPHHDPKDGRFTFGDGGGANMSRPPRAVQPGKGDGSWGGGGATGDGYWMTPAEIRAFRQRHPGLDPYMMGPGETVAQIAATRHLAVAEILKLNGLKQGAIVKPGQILALPKAATMQGGLRVVSSKGYDYRIDSADRMRRATGDLHLATKQERSRTNQRQAGGVNRSATDDGGHFIAARFGGPAENFKHFAQDANFNRGGYRALEDEWASEVRSGQSVHLDITEHYPGASKRPDTLGVTWVVNGKARIRHFSNEPKGLRRGR